MADGGPLNLTSEQLTDIYYSVPEGHDWKGHDSAFLYKVKVNEDAKPGKLTKEISNVPYNLVDSTTIPLTYPVGTQVTNLQISDGKGKVLCMLIGDKIYLGWVDSSAIADDSGPVAPTVHWKDGMLIPIPKGNSHPRNTYYLIFNAGPTGMNYVGEGTSGGTISFEELNKIPEQVPPGTDWKGTPASLLYRPGSGSEAPKIATTTISSMKSTLVDGSDIPASISPGSQLDYYGSDSTGNYYLVGYDNFYGWVPKNQVRDM